MCSVNDLFLLNMCLYKPSVNGHGNLVHVCNMYTYSCILAKWLRVT